MFWIGLSGAIVSFGICELGFGALMGMDKDKTLSRNDKIVKRIVFSLVILAGVSFAVPFLAILVRIGLT